MKIRQDGARMLKAAMIFGDNMVLQRRETIPIWGEAEHIDSITI